MKDEQKAKFFFDIQNSEAFQAQLILEKEQYDSLLNKLTVIDPKSNIEFEYARVRGALEALKNLKAIREKLVEDFRSRIRNS